jgi:hypothetical protein
VRKGRDVRACSVARSDEPYANHASCHEHTPGDHFCQGLPRTLGAAYTPATVATTDAATTKTARAVSSACRCPMPYDNDDA